MTSKLQVAVQVTTCKEWEHTVASTLQATQLVSFTLHLICCIYFFGLSSYIDCNCRGDMGFNPTGKISSLLA